MVFWLDLQAVKPIPAININSTKRVIFFISMLLRGANLQKNCPYL